MSATKIVPRLAPPENKLFFPGLNGLRAIAVLMVFENHYLPEVAGGAWGWAGVELFFVLSGFLITGILFDTQNKADRFSVFYVRRALRIFPLYYGVLLLVLLSWPFFHWYWHPAFLLRPIYLSNFTRFLWFADFQRNPLIEHVSSDTHVLNVGHFWSLCVEEQFYLVWPLVVFSIRDRVRLRNLCAAIVVVVLLMRIGAYFVIPQPFLKAYVFYIATPFCMDALLFGGLLALMWRGPERQMMLRALHPAIGFFAVAFGIFQAVYLVLTHHLYQVNLTGPIFSTVGMSLIIIFCGLVVLWSLNAKPLTWGPLMLLGEMSYGFYVFHDIPHATYTGFVRRFFPSHGEHLTAAVAFICTLVFASLSYSFYETPFLKLKARFT